MTARSSRRDNVGPPPPGTAFSPLETIAFDSDNFPPAERFERYRRFYQHGADVEATGPNFRAKVRALRLDRVNVFARELGDVAHRRGPDRVAIDGFDHLTVTIVRAGTYEVDTGTGFRTIPAGCGVVVDMLAPMRNRARDATIVTMSVARSRLVGVLGAADGLHGRFIGAGDAALLLDLVVALLRRVESLSDAAVVPATHALCTLIAAAIGTASEVGDPSAGAIRDSIRIGRVRALVDARLSDPEFGADAVVAQAGIARATLYRAFRAQGGIAGYIRARRLEQLRMTLSDPSDTRSFAQAVVDAGLKSEAHGSRLFLERFGSRPGEYRAAMTTQHGPDAAVQTMIRWQRTLRDGDMKDEFSAENRGSGRSTSHP